MYSTRNEVFNVVYDISTYREGAIRSAAVNQTLYNRCTVLLQLPESAVDEQPTTRLGKQILGSMDLAMGRLL